MYAPVIRWLEDSGFTWTKHLCTPAYNQCDLAGGKYAERIGRRRPDLLESVFIELKLSNVGQAIAQASHYHNYVNLSYVAMPAERCELMKPETLARFETSGLGLLTVTLDTVLEIVKPNRKPQTHQMVARNLWRRTRNKKSLTT